MPGLERFKVIDAADANFPHKCSGCGTTTGAWVDLAVMMAIIDTHYDGMVYLCLDNCFNELATQLGWLSPTATESLRHTVSTLESMNANLAENNKELRDGLASLDNLSSLLERGSVNGDWNGDSSTKDLPGVIESVEASDEGSERSVEDILSELNGTEQRSAEQNDEQGSSDVFDDDSATSILGDI